MTRSSLLIAALSAATLTTPLLAKPISGIVFEDLNRNRVFDKGEPVIPNVGVSNGRDVVQTNNSGKYKLKIADDTDAIFVIKPSGYMTPVDDKNFPKFYYIHRPEGSPEGLKYEGVAPTGSSPKVLNFPLYKQKESSDYKVLIFGDPQVPTYTKMTYFRHDFIEPLIGTEAKFGVALGDLASNRLTIFKDYKDSISQLGIPFYSILGNHDINFNVEDDKHSGETWLATFGPTYYSFNWGDVHYIVLDDVIYHGIDNKKKYHGGLDEKQLEFIKNDLKYVPKDKLIVPLMHIPIVQFREKNRKEFFDLIKDYPNTFSASAHRHFQRHDFFDSERGWTNAASPEHHHLVASVCSGTWWGGQYDEHGTSVATQRDGSPNAYNLMTVTGSDYKLRTIGARHPESYQISIYLPRKIEQSELAETAATINLFGGSTKNKTYARVIGQTEFELATNIQAIDPYHLENVQRHKDGHYPKDNSLSLESKTDHFASFALPANLPVGIYTLHVKTTDMFDQADEAYFLFNVVADED
ncbi:calcineurin-like phosphoesterase C-terminal domain-containing protein [Planctomycetota bacterium]|nr:calcineurin-like phosphoesterase C-terminal domain-containing protein [Planctomycetota bacterium]